MSRSLLYSLSMKSSKSKTCLQFLKEQQMILFVPTPSGEHTGHYLKYHEMCKLELFPLEGRWWNAFCGITLCRCSKCPGHSFFSAANWQRHNRLIHKGPKDQMSSIKQNTFVYNDELCGKSSSLDIGCNSTTSLLTTSECRRHKGFKKWNKFSYM